MNIEIQKVMNPFLKWELTEPEQDTDILSLTCCEQKLSMGGTTVNCQGVWGGGNPPPPAASGKKETMVVKQGLKGTEKQTEDGFSL